MSDRGADGENARLPDSIDQRLDTCTDHLYGGLIGLVMGFCGAVASIGFVSAALIERSQPVALLDRAGAAANRMLESLLGPEIAGRIDLVPGDYGTAILAGALVALYIPTVTLFAWRVGHVVQRRTLERQRSDGAWRGELASMLNRVGLVAASCGQVAQRITNARLYAGIDRAWGRQNVWVATMLMFTEVSNFLSQRLLAYVPALPALFSGAHELPHLCRQLRADGRADRRRLVVHQRDVRDRHPQGERGPADRARRGDRAGARPRPLLRRDRRPQLQAARRSSPARRWRSRGSSSATAGTTRVPFITVPRVVLRQGDWLHISGPSGCGKSSLLKAVAGLWPYGEGRVAVAAGARMFLTPQEPDLPERLTLKELVTYPRRGAEFETLAVAEVLSRAGLGELDPRARPRAAPGAALARRAVRRPEAAAGPRTDAAAGAGHPAARRGDLGARSEGRRRLSPRAGRAACPTRSSSRCCTPTPSRRTAFGRPFYNRTLEVGHRLAMAGGFAEAGPVAIRTLPSPPPFRRASSSRVPERAAPVMPVRKAQDEQRAVEYVEPCGPPARSAALSVRAEPSDRRARPTSSTTTPCSTSCSARPSATSGTSPIPVTASRASGATSRPGTASRRSPPAAAASA